MTSGIWWLLMQPLKSPMKLKTDAKFKQKMTCDFKYDMWNLVAFNATTQKSKNFTSMGYFCPKYMRFDLKKIHGISLS